MESALLITITSISSEKVHIWGGTLAKRCEYASRWSREENSCFFSNCYWMYFIGYVPRNRLNEWDSVWSVSRYRTDVSSKRRADEQLFDEQNFCNNAFVTEFITT